MRRKCLFGFAVSMIVLMTACGVNTASNQEDASGSAVDLSDRVESISGSALDATAEDMGLNSFSDKALTNSSNYYEDLFETDTEADGLVQYDRKGKKIKEYIFADDTVAYEHQDYEWIYANDDSIVYSIYDERGNGTITFYELPIKKGKDGNDIIRPEQSVELFSAEEKGMEDFENEFTYADSDYIIAISDAGHYFRYERKTKKIVREKPFQDYLKDRDDLCELLYGAIGTDGIFCSVYSDYDVKDGYRHNRLIFHDLRTMEFKEIFDGKEDAEFDIIASYGDEILFEADDMVESVYRYHRGDKKVSVAVTDSKICRLMKDQRIGDKKLSDITVKVSAYDYWIGTFGGRQYMSAILMCAEDKTLTTCRVIISIGYEEGDIKYEKEITEHMWDAGVWKYVKGSFDDTTIVSQYFTGEKFRKVRTNDTDCLTMKQGRILIVKDTKKGTYDSEVYEIATGKSKKVEKEDLREFYPMYEKWTTSDSYFTSPQGEKSKNVFVYVYLNEEEEQKVVYEEK